MSTITIGSLSLPSCDVIIRNSHVTVEVDLHDLAVALHQLVLDVDRKENAGDHIPASLAIVALAERLEEVRRDAIGTWMDRNQT